MSGRILYRGVMAADSHPLADRPKSRPPSTSCEETLDPRIQVELEKLNKASEDINRLELQLNEARAKFRQVLTESTQMLNIQAKKLGSCIDKARPYYEARIKAKQAQAATQNAALRYERAHGQLAAAKEMVYLAEEGFFKKGQPFDPAWQEMLNHATIKVNDAEKERYESQLEHQRTAQLFAESEQTVKKLQKDLRRHISKSRPYFEMKAKVNQQMEEQKKYVSQLEDEVLSIKRHYAATLSNLERISDEIHRQRKKTDAGRDLGTRGVGVGAESPAPATDSADPEDVRRARTRSKPDRAVGEAASDAPNRRESVSRSEEIVCSPDKLKSALRAGESSEAAASSGAEAGHVIGGDDDVVVLRRSKQTIRVSELRDKRLGEPIEQQSREGESLRNGDSSRNGETSEEPPVTAPEPSSVHQAAPPAPVLPTVQVTPPSISAPTSPTRPDPAQDLADRNVRDNAELMACLQRQKGLRASRRQSLDDTYSDSESLSGSVASTSAMMDDDQIQSLMLEMADYARFVERMDDKRNGVGGGWKRLSLPTKLTQLDADFDLDRFLAEARIAEEETSEDSALFGEKLPPMAQQEDDEEELSFEFIEDVSEEPETRNHRADEGEADDRN